MVEETVNRIASVLSSAAGVERVILFGSQARGDAEPDSDVDLFVVVDHTDSTVRTAAELLRLLRDCRVPIDLIVRTRAQVQELEDDGNFFWARVRREGRQLVAREGA